MSPYQYFNDILCVAGKVLRKDQNPEGLVSEHVWDDWIKRHGANLVQRGGHGRTSLIEFNTIPPKYRELIRKTYGDPEKKAQESGFLKYIKPDKAAAQYFLEYIKADGNHLPEKHIKLYTANACILNALKELYNIQRMARARHGKGMQGFWPRMAKVVASIKGEFPHSLQKNHRALQRQYDEYYKVGYEAIISGKFCNPNASKITEDIEAWMVRELAMSRQSIDVIYMKYHDVALANGWRTDITASAFRQRSEKKEIKQKIALARHGRKGYQKLYGQSLKLKQPKYSNDIWFGDGSGTGWCYRTDKNTIGYAYTYFVMDSRSKKFLAWVTHAHVNKENGAMQRKAYREALRNSGYCQPYQIIVDNQGGHKTTESQHLLKRIALSGHVDFSKPHRSKGRGIERAFMDFQQMKLSEFFFWSGFGRHTHSNIENAPNTEFMEKHKEDLPSYQELLKLLDIVVNEWNDMHYKDRPSANDLYEEHRNPEEEQMDISTVSDLFFDMAGPKKYHPYGIKLTYQGEEFDYEVYDEHGDVDYEFRKKYMGMSLWMKYDPDREWKDIDLYIVHPTGGYQKIATASPKREVSRSSKYHQPGDVAWINRQMKREDEFMEELENEVEATGYSEAIKINAWKERIAIKQPVMAHDDDEDDPDKLFLNRI